MTAPPQFPEASPRGPLAGVVVLDVTRVVAGPFCSMILADLGATVIKIERPTDPDYARDFPPFLESDDGDRFSAFFAQYNRNKLGLTLDLAVPEGKKLLKQLAERADVLVENFRPGTMDKLGLGHTVLREVNPRLVYTAISGFGQTGPYRRRPAFDNSAQAAGGLWSMNGYPDRPPTRVGTIIGDLAATMYAVIGTLAALRHAERTGEGQLVDVAQQDSVLSLTESAVVSYTVDGTVAKPLGNAHSFVRPYELYPCKDGYVFFGGYTDKLWRLTCAMFGEPELADDPEIDTMTKRFDPEVYERRIRPLLNRWMASRTRAELEELAGEQVPLTAIKDIGDVVNDPHIKARDMIVDVEYPDFGRLEMFGQPIHLDATPAQPRGLAPKVGEHTDTLLRGLVGLSDDKIAALRRSGVV
ncbi:CaiB/BaiF CoA transferase family protein [Saccharopolyspora phatthalungensis]|uniref:Crotonobetainyl-CoA:carnitine CoA-transferase CaiB-like acyl-CoA transferase n=1 Tax=Saccharopolyspora phatthalungensis TaxID=664693 RepID=A0A840QGL4_9PSEU|nr:CoA transferase [Saccharopolyspora phatthalungensis]MBB5159626.1 crotonobetainyl-CoA:carnitine CoA-transferase CaiB-like acyl-CoA transferase [Saccharopolyspora phatthalungensis]